MSNLLSAIGKPGVLDKYIAFGLMGSIIGGVVSGYAYQVVLYPAMALYTLTAWKVVTKLSRRRAAYIIDDVLFLPALFLGIYSLFMFQAITIIISGSTTYPVLWWPVHGGVAVFIYLLVHSLTRE